MVVRSGPWKHLSPPLLQVHGYSEPPSPHGCSLGDQGLAVTSLVGQLPLGRTCFLIFSHYLLQSSLRSPPGWASPRHIPSVRPWGLRVVWRGPSHPPAAQQNNGFASSMRHPEAYVYHVFFFNFNTQFKFSISTTFYEEEKR